MRELFAMRDRIFLSSNTQDFIEVTAPTALSTTCSNS